MKKYFLLIVLMLAYSQTIASDSIQMLIPEPKADALEVLQTRLVERNYVIFTNLDYWVDTCYTSTLRAHDEYSQDFVELPFSDATFNAVNITDYDCAIFPIGNSGPGGVTMPPNWGSRFGLSSGTQGGIKIIDKIMEMANAGKGVIIIAQNALWGNSASPDGDVSNFLENIMGIDYQGKYKCSRVSSSGGSTSYEWWMFKIEGTIGDPVGMGLPKYFNGGDESSGNAIQPHSYFLDVDWFFSTDNETFPITERSLTAQSDTAFGIRAEYFSDEETRSRITFMSVPWEGFGGLWDIKKIMMWNAMRWVLDESGAPGPEISVDPAHLDFGSVEDGEKGEMSFEVKNVGVETLEISQLCTIYWDDETIYPEGSSAFSVTENLIYYGDPKLSIEPGESETVKVEFQPDMGEGEYRMMIEISSNAKAQPNLKFALEGYGGEKPPEGGNFAVDVDTLQFGEVSSEGQKSDMDLVLRNIGDSEILISVYIDDETNDDLSFSFAQTINNPKYIDPTDSLVYQVRFFPLEENKDYYGKVRVDVDQAVNGNEFFIDLHGSSSVWSSVSDNTDSNLDISVLPSLNDGNFTFKVDSKYISPFNSSITIRDINGRTVKTISNSEEVNSGISEFRVSMPMAPQGRYFICLNYMERTLNIPFIIER